MRVASLYVDCARGYHAHFISSSYCETFVCRYLCHVSYSLQNVRVRSSRQHPPTPPPPSLPPPPPLTCSLALTLYILVDQHTSLRRLANPPLGALSSTPRAGLQTARSSALRSSDAIAPRCVHCGPARASRAAALQNNDNDQTANTSVRARSPRGGGAFSFKAKVKQDRLPTFEEQ